MRAPTPPLLAALAVLLAACRSGQPDAGAELSLEAAAVAGGTRLLLIAPAGARISAGVTPTFELRDGRRIRFDTTAVTADSLYYTAPPAALVDLPPAALHGILRASICDSGANFCRLARKEI